MLEVTVSMAYAVLHSVSMQLTLPAQTWCFILMVFQSHTIFLRPFVHFDKILLHSDLVLKLA